MWKWDRLSFKLLTDPYLLIKVAGEMSYNGHKLEEFVPQKSSAYVSQYDLHIPEMTVRETIDFSARCQGAGSRAGKNSLQTQVVNFSFN